MLKFSILAKPRDVLWYQGFCGSPGTWASLGVRGHIGIDITRGEDAPIPAYFAGTVVYVNRNGGDVVYLAGKFEEQMLEICHSHMRNIMVNIGDRVDAGQIIGHQDSHGPSLAWKDGDLDKTSWSHEHINARIALKGKDKHQKLIWDFGRDSSVDYHIEEYDASMDHFRDPSLWNIQIIDTFIKAIARHEGFTSGASRIAVECNNPGNLRYSPLADGYREFGTPAKPNRFAYFNTVAKGWEALRRDIEIKATGRSQHMTADATIAKFCAVWAPSSDNNNPKRYAEVLIEECGLKSIENPISDVMLTEFEYIRKYNDFSFGWYVNAESRGSVWSNIFKLFRYIWNSSRVVGRKVGRAFRK